MSATKKAKVVDDFDLLRQYIMNCPDVPKDSPAVQAALKGLEQEVQKRERDAKLQRKFTTQNKNTLTDESNNHTAMDDDKTTTIVHQGESIRPAASADDDDDWHDVSGSSAERGLGDDLEAESSALGVSLSKAVIVSIAEAQIEVETPTAAVALALHAALRSELLGFACTGIPEDSNAGGFAPPIRELPKTQFIPPKWDEHANRQSAAAASCHVALRYRKSGTGSVILVVTLEDDGTEKKVRIQLIPATTLTQEPPNAEGMVVALYQHINPDSFAAALKQGKVQPALHYKRLAVLLTTFMNRFDLGQVKESDAPMEDAWNNTATQPPSSQPVYTPVQPLHTNRFQDPLRIPGQNPFPNFADTFDRSEFAVEFHRPHFAGHPVDGPPQMDIFDRRYPAGDFAGDFMPGGLIDPGLGGGGGGGGRGFQPGNLMGPDHPMFHGGGGGLSGVGPHSGYGMKPRFDPFGPPGGPTEPFHVGDANKSKTKVPPGGTGEPNPDHMRPPNNLNNNMFG